jgi:peroxiredoxin Q/BCP
MALLPVNKVNGGVTMSTNQETLKTGVKVGDAAPDFTLPNQSGELFSLSSLLGKKSIVLYFYPKDFSRGCTAEACAFRDSYEAFKQAGAEVVGVSSQSVESHDKFASLYKLPFILLSDEDQRVRKLYGVPTTLGVLPGRVTYVIDKKGTVRYIFNSQFNPTKHIEEALAILKTINDE